MVISETCDCLLDNEKRVLVSDLLRGINLQERFRDDIKKDGVMPKEQKDAVIEQIDRQIQDRQSLIDEIEKIKPCTGNPFIRRHTRRKERREERREEK